MVWQSENGFTPAARIVEIKFSELILNAVLKQKKIWHTELQIVIITPKYNKSKIFFKEYNGTIKKISVRWLYIEGPVIF